VLLCRKDSICYFTALPGPRWSLADQYTFFAFKNTVRPQFGPFIFFITLAEAHADPNTYRVWLCVSMSLFKDFQQPQLSLWELYWNTREPNDSPFQYPKHERQSGFKRRGSTLSQSTEAHCEWASLRKFQGDGGFDDAATLQGMCALSITTCH
jgi:hypothetical protein